jgi:hypothetical protein
MRRVTLRLGAAFALGLVLVSLPVLADETQPTKESPAKLPSFADYVYVADVVGEVVRADDKSVTLRITWYVPQQSGNGNRNSRPRLSQNNRNFHNPYGNRSNNQRQPQLKQQHHDYVLEFVPQSLVRTKTLPPKTDDKGKKVPYTQKELEEARLPIGAPYYAASSFDLTPGTIVDVIVIRERSIPAAKATEDDLRVKYVTILGRDPNPPKDIQNGGNNNAKNAKNAKNN